jgi:glycerol-3-phosphate dehydrogenase
MLRNLDNLANRYFDVLIIGGGITGAFLAYDASLRGLSVALVEKNDFGGYTSSASSKLLHGGVRYLPHGQLWKVRESYRESLIFQHIAPHLTRWIPFLVPTESGSLMKGKFAMQMAMHMYRLCGAGLDGVVADKRKLPPHGIFLSPEETRSAIPGLGSYRDLTGAQVLWESHMFNSERMTLAVIKSAAWHGAQVANYVEVTRLLMESGVVGGAQVRDHLSQTVFDIRARQTINAAGPYVQDINGTVPALQLKRRLTGFSKGMHLVTRQINPEYALAMTTGKKTEGLVSRGGRHFFIIPWRGCSLIGTTNVPFSGHLDTLRIIEADIIDFLKDIKTALPDVHLTREDVRYAFCGIYPLIATDVRSDTYQGTGDYQVIDHEKADRVGGIITVLGAKFTTARYVAEKGVDLAMVKLRHAKVSSRTGTCQLGEGEIDDIQAFQDECRRIYAQELPADIIDAMIYNHGKEIHNLVAEGLKGNLLQRTAVDCEVIDIELDHAVRNEMALSLEDLLFRRTGLGTLGNPGLNTIKHCADLMGDILGWNAMERDRQINCVASRYRYSQS